MSLRCPLCHGPMHWAVPPDARAERWWCDAWPHCFGRCEPEAQLDMAHLLEHAERRAVLGA